MRATSFARGVRPMLSLLVAAGALAAGQAAAVPPAEIYKRAQQEKPALIDTMKTLVSIESGSRDLEGLDRIAGVIADRLRLLGGDVKLVDPTDHAYRMADTPEKIGKMVLARFKGEGKRNIMLIAHMDTVYLKGMLAQQPFRIDGDRAYGLGIADDKNGVAVILHTVSILQSVGFKQYGTLTVLINGDEEISSPGARTLLAKLGAEQDAVFSCEGTRASTDKLSLATSGIGAILLDVKGKASHAGGAPEQGRNALYELSHQVLQLRDLSNPQTGLKVNWTLAQAGTNRNVIPATASAQADVRLLRAADADKLEDTINERIKTRLIPDTPVTASSNAAGRRWRRRRRRIVSANMRRRSTANSASRLRSTTRRRAAAPTPHSPPPGHRRRFSSASAWPAPARTRTRRNTST